MMCARVWGNDPEGVEPRERRDPLAEWLKRLGPKDARIARTEFAAEVAAQLRQHRRDAWAWVLFVVLPTAGLFAAVVYWR